MKGSGGPAFVAIALLAACGASKPAVSQQAGKTDQPAQVSVSLVEFRVRATPDRVSAGRVVFNVHNDGELPVHELVIVRTDLTIPQLPRNPDGSFNERGRGVSVIAEIEGIRRQAMRTLMLDLEAGHYVLLCNIVGQHGSHFAEGMHTDFNVL
jgi:hypothetical protein